MQIWSIFYCFLRLISPLSLTLFVMSFVIPKSFDIDASGTQCRIAQRSDLVAQHVIHQNRICGTHSQMFIHAGLTELVPECLWPFGCEVFCNWRHNVHAVHLKKHDHSLCNRKAVQKTTGTTTTMQRNRRAHFRQHNKCVSTFWLVPLCTHHKHLQTGANL